MKKIIFSLLLLASSTCFGADNDTLPERPVFGVVKFSPISFFASTMMVGYERALGNQTSFVFISGIVAKKSSDYQYEVLNLGVSAEIQLRQYLLSEENLKGLYTGIYGKFFYMETDFDYDPNSYPPYYPVDQPKENYDLARYSAGILAGYQFIIKNRVAIDVYLGGGILYSDSNYDSFIKNNYYWDALDSFYPDRTGISAKGGIMAGITF